MSDQTLTDDERIKLGVQNDLGMVIDNFANYGDGVSFTVATELEAYKAAYHYRFCKTVRVLQKQTFPVGWFRFIRCRNERR